MKGRRLLLLDGATATFKGTARYHAQVLIYILLGAVFYMPTLQNQILVELEKRKRCSMLGARQRLTR